MSSVVRIVGRVDEVVWAGEVIGEGIGLVFVWERGVPSLLVWAVETHGGTLRGGSHGDRTLRVKESPWIEVVDRASRMGPTVVASQRTGPRQCKCVGMVASTKEARRRRDTRKRSRSASKDATVFDWRQLPDGGFVEEEI
ncbi:hypothetical protein HN51_067090 [Arachis hypogaea]